MFTRTRGSLACHCAIWLGLTLALSLRPSLAQSELGENDVQLTTIGPRADPTWYPLLMPAIAYNAIDDEVLVASIDQFGTVEAVRVSRSTGLPIAAPTEIATGAETGQDQRPITG